MPAATPAVSIQSLSKIYPPRAHVAGLCALDEVSFDIEQGEFFGLLGPNGAGKTTLISILAGLTQATQGTIKVHGLDVRQHAAQARRYLGIVPQELVYDPIFSVREMLRFQSGYFGIYNNAAWIDELLHGLGLADKADANMRQLSGGMKRRALVALALVHKPPVIVLDEPTAGVDVELRQTLWRFVADLNRQGHTVLLTTHYLEEAEALCNRIAMLKQGRLLALEKTSTLLRNAAVGVLHFKTDHPLPAELAARARITGRVVEWPAHSAEEIEQSLATLRQAGIAVEDLEVRKANLEDVFIRLMGDAVDSVDPTDQSLQALAQQKTAANQLPAAVQLPNQPTSQIQVPQAQATQARALQIRPSSPADGSGCKMLFYKELLRFWHVGLQTLAAPILTTVLYLLIFGNVLNRQAMPGYGGISYVAFLVPGLVMMSVLQNAFANSASSLVQSKIMGNLVFLQLSPLSHWHWYVAYVGASIVRALLVGLGVYAVTLFYTPPHAAALGWIVVFAMLGAAMMGALGILAGLWADKFDQMAMFQNFIIMPLTFLAGVFYSVHNLPGIWQQVSHLNPFFYMIDGFRYGFFGQSDVSPWLSLLVAGGAFAGVTWLVLHLLKTGYKLRQ